MILCTIPQDLEAVVDEDDVDYDDEGRTEEDVQYPR